MKCHQLSALLVALLLWSSAGAAIAQEEPAKTPTNLIELLPEGDRPSMDFYLMMDMGGQGIDESMFMHWRVTPHERGITVLMHNGGGEGFDNTQSTEYDTEGKLQSYRSQMRFGEDFSNDVVGTVQGDTLVLVSTSRQNIPGVENGVPDDEREVVDLAEFADVVPTAWLPVAIGYHLRQENPVFQVRMADYGQRFGTQIMTFDDIGTEMMEVRGEKQKVHVLVGKMGFEAAEDDDVEIALGDEQIMHLRCLPSGEIVEMKVSSKEAGEQMNMTARSATPAQIREKFGDAAVEGGAVEDQDEAEAQEGQ